MTDRQKGTSDEGQLPFVLRVAVPATPEQLRQRMADTDPSTFDEAPTVNEARPAAAALVAEHVEENLRLHARVNELEARVRELDQDRIAERKRADELEVKVQERHCAWVIADKYCAEARARVNELEAALQQALGGKAKAGE